MGVLRCLRTGLVAVLVLMLCCGCGMKEPSQDAETEKEEAQEEAREYLPAEAEQEKNVPAPAEELTSQARPLSKEKPWEQYPAVNQVPHLVETRYAGFQEPGEYGTLFLPEILLDSPGAEAANQALEELYLEGPREALSYDGWEPDWDYVWCEAYEWNGLLCR